MLFTIEYKYTNIILKCFSKRRHSNINTTDATIKILKLKPNVSNKSNLKNKTNEYKGVIVDKTVRYNKFDAFAKKLKKQEKGKMNALVQSAIIIQYSTIEYSKSPLPSA